MTLADPPTARAVEILLGISYKVGYGAITLASVRAKTGRNPKYTHAKLLNVRFSDTRSQPFGGTTISGNGNNGSTSTHLPHQSQQQPAPLYAPLYSSAEGLHSSAAPALKCFLYYTLHKDRNLRAFESEGMNSIHELRRIIINGHGQVDEKLTDSLIDLLCVDPRGGQIVRESDPSHVITCDDIFGATISVTQPEESQKAADKEENPAKKAKRQNQDQDQDEDAEAEPQQGAPAPGKSLAPLEQWWQDIVQVLGIPTSYAINREAIVSYATALSKSDFPMSVDNKEFLSCFSFVGLKQGQTTATTTAQGAEPNKSASTATASDSTDTIASDRTQATGEEAPNDTSAQKRDGNGEASVANNEVQPNQAFYPTDRPFIKIPFFKNLKITVLPRKRQSMHVQAATGIAINAATTPSSTSEEEPKQQQQQQHYQQPQLPFLPQAEHKNPLRPVGQSQLREEDGHPSAFKTLDAPPTPIYPFSEAQAQLLDRGMSFVLAALSNGSREKALSILGMDETLLGSQPGDKPLASSADNASTSVSDAEALLPGTSLLPPPGVLESSLTGSLPNRSSSFLRRSVLDNPVGGLRIPGVMGPSASSSANANQGFSPVDSTPFLMSLLSGSFLAGDDPQQQQQQLLHDAATNFANPSSASDLWPSTMRTLSSMFPSQTQQEAVATRLTSFFAESITSAPLPGDLPASQATHQQQQQQQQHNGSEAANSAATNTQQALISTPGESLNRTRGTRASLNGARANAVAGSDGADAEALSAAQPPSNSSNALLSLDSDANPVIVRTAPATVPMSARHVAPAHQQNDTHWPEEWLDMAVIDFNRFVKARGFSVAEVISLKKARRKKKSRLYAKRSREKKAAKIKELESLKQQQQHGGKMEVSESGVPEATTPTTDAEPTVPEAAPPATTTGLAENAPEPLTATSAHADHQGDASVSLTPPHGHQTLQPQPQQQQLHVPQQPLATPTQLKTPHGA